MIKEFLKYLYTKFITGKNAKIGFMAFSSRKTFFDEMTQLHQRSQFHGSIGMGSYIGENSVLSAHIGRFSSISNNVLCNTGYHPYKEPFVSTSPCFFSLNKNHMQCGSTFATEQIVEEHRYLYPDESIALEIGNDVWVGERVFFVGGVKVGDGAVVLSGAVISKDVPPYAIVGGVPAKIIGYRYDEETIDWLLNIKWWDNPKEWFSQNWRLLTNIEKLKEYYSNKK